MDTIRQNAKALVAFLGGLGAWGAAAAPDGYDQVELWGLLAVAATAVTVWAVPNRKG